MSIHEWCIAVLKGKSTNTRFTEMYNLCTKHYKESSFNSEEDLFTALEPFKDYFIFEDFKYDYVTFEDDGLIDTPILEKAKEVLRSHFNRYSLEVLCRKMNDDEQDEALDETTLKNLLSERECFSIENRSFTLFKLSPKGETFDISPISFKRPAKSEEQKRQEAELKRQEAEQKRHKKMAEEKIKLEDLSPRQIMLLKKAILDEMKEKQMKKKQMAAEHKEEYRIEKIRKIIAYYQITDDTTVEQLWTDKLIRKEEYTKCVEWSLYTVGKVYKWVDSNRMAEKLDYYRKKTVQRMLKIASFHDPELARLIPNVKFSGIQKANRTIRLSKSSLQKT